MKKKRKIEFGDVASAVRRNTGLEIGRVNWFSTYHVHHRVVNHFQRGRIFLVGDAAHIHSPAGGQGMNTGIGDAVNLAWKLADVIDENAAPALLDSYEPERLPFAKVLLSTTDTAFRFLTNRSFFGAAFRAFLLPNLFARLTRFPVFLRFAFRTISQLRIQYRLSPLSWGGNGPLRAGDRLPWVRFGDRDNFPSTMDWQIHLYGNGALPVSPIEGRSFPINEEAKQKGVSNGLYLVRPDGHIAYIGGPLDGDGVLAYLKKIGYLPARK